MSVASRAIEASWAVLGACVGPWRIDADQPRVARQRRRRPSAARASYVSGSGCSSSKGFHNGGHEALERLRSAGLPDDGAEAVDQPDGA